MILSFAYSYSSFALEMCGILTPSPTPSLPPPPPPPPFPQVLELQGDGEASPWSWASPGWITFPAPFAALTICLHVLAPALRLSGTIFSLATNTTDNFLTLDVKEHGLNFCVGGVWNSSSAVIYPGMWTSLCLAYHPAWGWTSYIDGHDDDSGFLHDPDGEKDGISLCDD
ncbi:uncharacterized protein LOC123520047 [Portunus trituberculatus]|uniref:uncharacterized protein LOC123520047 n=1 Tax=Portunus trituberculatus TaxID=210409 RepID=UPI001E1CDA99|nr:uncharacterized protein LOC123520047 [Portunus trituberculatus]